MLLLKEYLKKLLESAQEEISLEDVWVIWDFINENPGKYYNIKDIVRVRLVNPQYEDGEYTGESVIEVKYINKENYHGFFDPILRGEYITDYNSQQELLETIKIRIIQHIERLEFKTKFLELMKKNGFERYDFAIGSYWIFHKLFSSSEAVVYFMPAPPKIIVNPTLRREFERGVINLGDYNGLFSESPDELINQIQNEIKKSEEFIMQSERET